MASIVITENSSYLSVKESSTYIIDNPKIGNEYFTQLKDSPSSFNGNEGYVLSVKGDASGLEFTDLNQKYLGLNAKASSALTADSVQWVDVENKPITFDPSVHLHAISDVSGLQTDLDSKADDSATSEALGSLGAQLIGKANTSHGHGISDVTGLQTEVDNLVANSGAHTHLISDVQNLQTDLDAKAGKVVTSAALSSLGAQVAAKANTSHSHEISDVTDLQNELESKADDSATSAALSSLGAQVAAKANVSHTHTISDVSALQTELDSKADDSATSAALGSLGAQLVGKANTSHGHAISDTSGLQAALDEKLSNTAQAADSNLLGGKDSTEFVLQTDSIDWARITNAPAFGIGTITGRSGRKSTYSGSGSLTSAYPHYVEVEQTGTLLRARNYYSKYNCNCNCTG